MKVVFDTNVFVSAFIVSGSRGEQALLLAYRRKVALYTSVPILTETVGFFARNLLNQNKTSRLR